MSPSLPAEPALTPAIHLILLALLPGELHGYAIMQSIEELTDGQTRMGPGTLYSSIKKMIDAGLIREAKTRPGSDDDDERRRYYGLTALGRKAVNSEAERLERLVRYTRAHTRAL